MLRAGLLVGPRTLTAAEALAEHWQLPRERLWGMSPFGGSTADPVWSAVDPRLFLGLGAQELSMPQAAFRAAYELPNVAAAAVGTDDPGHLADLVAALDHDTNAGAILEYRTLIGERQRSMPV